MKIVRLKAENIKRLKVVDITPNEHMNLISGGNGSGKTSILDAIEWALTGTSTVPSRPVRKGSGRAFSEVDLGEIVVTRRFVEGGSKNGVLAIESKSNKSRFQGPQELLDSYMPKISFDPLEFIRLHPKKQLEVLKTLVKVDAEVDINLKVEDDPDYLRRREAKKEKLAVETRRDAVYVPANLPKEKVDEAALVKQLREASDYNADIERQQRERDNVRLQRDQIVRSVDARGARINELRAEIERIEAELREDQKKAEANDKLMSKWKPLPELRNATDLAQNIDNARAVNQGIDRRALREQYQAETDALEVEITNLSAALDDRAAKKAAAMSAAEFPVPGLAFGDDEVIYNGFAFNQISNAEQIRCSVAIGMASNPELRVMRIKDGSLLDTDAMATLAEMAKGHDYQVWVEVVDESGKVGVYLEDGEVVAVNPEPVVSKSAPKKRAKKGAAAHA